MGAERREGYVLVCDDCGDDCMCLHDTVKDTEEHNGYGAWIVTLQGRAYCGNCRAFCAANGCQNTVRVDSDSIYCASHDPDAVDPRQAAEAAKGADDGNES